VDEDLRRVSAWVVEAAAQDGKGKSRSFMPSLAAPATLREADFVADPRPAHKAKAKPERRGGVRPERPERSGRPPARAKLPKGSVRGGRPKTSPVTGFGKPQAKRKKV
jgi:ribonuclease R